MVLVKYEYEDDARKLPLLPPAILDSVEELCQTIKRSFGLQQDFRLQCQVADFEMSLQASRWLPKINSKATVKLVYFEKLCERWWNDTSMSRSPKAHRCLTTDRTEPASASGSSPSTRLRVWPSVFTVPPFCHEAELQLEKANAECSSSGSSLSTSLKLKSHSGTNGWND